MTKGFWEADSVETKPDLASLQSEGYPTDGDPARGIPATLMGAAWFYLMDRVRTSVIEASGHTLENPPTEDEFLKALQSWDWAKPGTLGGSVIKEKGVGTEQLADKAVTPEKMAAVVLLADVQTLTEPQQTQTRKNIGMPDFYKAVVVANGGVAPG